VKNDHGNGNNALILPAGRVFERLRLIQRDKTVVALFYVNRWSEDAGGRLRRSPCRMKEFAAADGWPTYT
jgi:hypothetical protein